MSLSFGTGPLARDTDGAHTNYSVDAPKNRLLFEPYERRLRALVGDRVVLDTTRAHLLHETGHLPRPYAPLEDFDGSLLERTQQSTHCPYKGDASYWSVRVGDRTLDDAVWAYEEPLERAPWLEGFAALDWDRADAWFIEDERVFGHLRDPYHRVDVFETERPVRVSFGDTVVAETTRAKMLYETSLAPHVYVPAGDVAAGVLQPSESVSVCPYKGQGTYWHVAVDGRRVEDAAFSYETPLPEALKVGGHLCFDFGEGVRVDVAEPAERLTL